jgi:uncharacterized protein YndB with AHSA1/START domain
MNRPQPSDQATRILEITRVFSARRERVFQFFVDPELIPLWWGPDGFHTPAEKLEIEPREGGRHHKVMVLESSTIAAGMGVAVGTEFPDSARVVEIRAPELLVLSSDPQPEIGLVESTITRIEFHQDGPNRTRVVLVDGPYNEMMAPHAETGWLQSFGKLAKALDG